MKRAAWLAALAYPFALLSSPGRMPADSKLYLYLDPSKLLSRAPLTWDTSQFAGFAPHQLIAYLWPAGPWFWMADALGIPDWIAHRLWIATLLVLAGAGVMWLGRLVGLTSAAATAAGTVYMLSPYILAYVSRTSVMLLPWAALGWIVGLTMLALQQTGGHSGGRWSRWRATWHQPALIALVVLTVGSTNATALAMIVPAPVLMVAHEVWMRSVAWRQAVAVTLRIGLLCVLVSLWWVAELISQGQYGAAVLSYTETLEAVSSTATAPETVRGLGYWLNYIRDHVQATTESAGSYHTAPWLIVVGFALATIGIAGIVLTHWRYRVFAAGSLLVGMVLAVGVYPITGPAPLFAGVGDRSRSFIALALRSSTRALPMVILALALGAGALVTTIRVDRRRMAAAFGVGALAIVNLPSLWTARLVDPNLERDQDVPAAWVAAADALNAQPDGGRVLQLPGAEFGAFRWGYTVDPPLPGLTDRPLVTRDLQPLGSAAAMDLLYALDDRFQSGVIEPDSIAAIARLFGADTVWVAGDVAFERFRTPRPEPTADLYLRQPRGLGPPAPYGNPVVNDPAVPMVDEQSISDPLIGTPVAPILLVPVQNPIGVVRVKSSSVVISGSGDGLVDAAAAGLITGNELVIYAASSASEPRLDLAAEIDRAALVIVTDTNRDRAHHWRGSQDVWGFTEDGVDGPDSGSFDSQDQRLPVFPVQDASNQTFTRFEGPVTARASSYGQRLGYWPEYRAAMAIDADPATAWQVGTRADARGEWIELHIDEPVGAVSLVQPSGDRTVTAVDVAADGGAPIRVALDNSAPARIDLPVAASTIRITIRDVSPGVDPVGFSTIDVGLGPTLELVALPQDALALVDGQPLAIVLTRLDTRATNRERRDPETAIARTFELTAEERFDVSFTATLDARATDDALAALIGAPEVRASSTLAGVVSSRPWWATDHAIDTAWVSAMGHGVGEWIEFTPPDDIPFIEFVQPIRSDLALITGVQVERDGVVIDQVLSSNRGNLDVPAGDGVVRITVTSTDGATTLDRATGELVDLPVAFTEIVARPTSPTEPDLAVRAGCRDDLVLIDDRPFGVRVSGDDEVLQMGGTLTVEPCDHSPIDLDPGIHTIRTLPGLAVNIDRIVLRNQVASTPTESAVTLDYHSDSDERVTTVPACPNGCWLVLGEGLSTGWSARLSDGTSLGEPVLVDGGFNGWWLEPHTKAVEVQISWAGQRRVNVALLLSTLATAACIALAVRRRRRLPDEAHRLAVPTRSTIARRRAVQITVAGTILGLLCIGPLGALGAVAILAPALVWLRRPRLVSWAAVAGLVVAGSYVLLQTLRLEPKPGSSFLASTSDAHQPTLLGIVLALMAVLANTERPSRQPSVEHAAR